jgi:hypothetical protein
MDTPTRDGCIRAVTLNFDAAVTRLEQSLAEENFGVLCRIDIQAADSNLVVKSLTRDLNARFRRAVDRAAEFHS